MADKDKKADSSTLSGTDQTTDTNDVDKALFDKAFDDAVSLSELEAPHDKLKMMRSSTVQEEINKQHELEKLSIKIKNLKNELLPESIPSGANLKTTSVNISPPKATREDALSQEIKDAIQECGSDKLVKVRGKLKEYAEKNGGCIIEATDKCIKWKHPDTGEMKTLDMNALRARLRRLKAKNCDAKIR